MSHTSNNGLCTIVMLLHTGFDKYKGGLDTVHDLTGLYSVYAHWRNIEIMFHVSTLLPYEKHDPQKVDALILYMSAKFLMRRDSKESQVIVRTRGSTYQLLVFN